MTGWNMPPGVSKLPGDEDSHCDVCFKPSDICVCHECPHCGSYGDPLCYYTRKENQLLLTKAQLVARQEFIVARAEEKVRESKLTLKDLIAKNDPFAKESDGGEPYNLWSDKLEDQEDPFSIKLIWS